MTQPPGSDDGWREWSRYVLKEIERSAETYERLHQEIAGLRSDFATQQVEISAEIATLKIKAGLWGAVGAAIPVVIMLALNCS